LNDSNTQTNSSTSCDNMEWKTSLKILNEEGIGKSLSYLNSRQSSVTTSWGVDWSETYIARSFVRLLREERERKGLSMNMLAEKAGLHHSAVSRIEAQLRSPSLLQLKSGAPCNCGPRAKIEGLAHGNIPESPKFAFSALFRRGGLKDRSLGHYQHRAIQP
jgi:Helix-turn-helix